MDERPDEEAAGGSDDQHEQADVVEEAAVVLLQGLVDTGEGHLQVDHTQDLLLVGAGVAVDATAGRPVVDGSDQTQTPVPVRGPEDAGQFVLIGDRDRLAFPVTVGAGLFFLVHGVPALLRNGREDDQTLAVEDAQSLDAGLGPHVLHHLVDIVLAVFEHGMARAAPKGVAQTQGALNGFVLQVRGVQPHHRPGEQAQGHECDHSGQPEQPHAQARQHVPARRQVSASLSAIGQLHLSDRTRPLVLGGAAPKDDGRR